MKRLMPVVLALAAGCVAVPAPKRGPSDIVPETAAERDQREVAHEAFLKLHRAWLDGDAAASLSMMSVQGISDWLLTRTRDTGDPAWPKQLARLDAPSRVEFDAWVRFNKRVQIPIANTRPEVLPESILNSKWLRETWNHYFEAEKANLKHIAASMQVSEEDVYVEGTGMSVLVRLNRTPTHIYSMVQEGEGWRFDYAVRPAGKQK
jgi:hypothetical protein